MPCVARARMWWTGPHAHFSFRTRIVGCYLPRQHDPSKDGYAVLTHQTDATNEGQMRTTRTTGIQRAAANKSAITASFIDRQSVRNCRLALAAKPAWLTETRSLTCALGLRHIPPSGVAKLADKGLQGATSMSSPNKRCPLCAMQGASGGFNIPSVPAARSCRQAPEGVTLNRPTLMYRPSPPGERANNS